MADVQRVGKSLAFRLPAQLAKKRQIKAELTMRPNRRPKYRLADLLHNVKPHQLHGEIDFGPDVGSETVEWLCGHRKSRNAPTVIGCVSGERPRIH